MAEKIKTGKYYAKHYNSNWEKDPALKDGIQLTEEKDVLKGKPEAFCKVCQSHIRAHHGDLVLHASRIKHLEKVKLIVSAAVKDHRKLDDHDYTIVDGAAKTTDLRLAVFVAMHCSIKTIDHLGELLKDIGKNAPLENLKIHRTKCSSLIIAPAFLTDLVRDIWTADYSIIVDEATDVSTSKYMGMCIRYFSKSRKAIATGFLSVIEVISCKGQDLANAQLEYLKKIGLPTSQYFGIDTDGAPNMCRVGNSIYTHLKLVVPHLTLVQCVCHSLNKCAEYAFKKMSDDLSFLMSESTNYFAHSSKRWVAFVAYYKEKNPEKPAPNKLVKLAQTRW